MNNTGYNVKNVMVAKVKVSDFIDMYHANEILKTCPITRILPSGNYHIYTFEIVVPEQRDELNRIQDEWI
ncbi:MAG: hypothetical protein J6A29_06675 [Clostridia bacterium]|nr:hypothetical protein [Clostridia bacterium]